MKSDILEKIKKYFYIPEKAKLEISKKNLRICSVALCFLFVLGLIGYYHEIAHHEVVSIGHLLYYSCYILAGLIFFVVRRLTKEKESCRANQFLLLFTCTFVSLILFYFIADEYNTNSLLSFYFAIFVMMISFEVNPIFYTIIIIFFFFEFLYFNSKTPDFSAILHLNNALFCLALIFFAFFKRKMTSVRELNKLEIEEKNRQLGVQNIELNRQKDSLLVNKQYLEDAVFNQSQELQLQKERIISIQNNTIVSLSNLVENRDEDTGEHVLRTRDYVQLIATKAFMSGKFPELNEDLVNLFYKAAPMHDIGKIVVPDAVLKKQGKLTPEEFELIKLHTTRGGEIVEDVLGAAEDEEYVKVTKEIATSHHEKVDGSGYPYGLKWDEIPLSARIMAIADVFDALVSPRCYKEPMPLDKAFGIIEEEAGSHFDPELAELFLESKDEVVAILNKYQNYKKS